MTSHAVKTKRFKTAETISSADFKSSLVWKTAVRASVSVFVFAVLILSY
jgi:hypothetical protein